MIQDRVIREFRQEVQQSKLPGYRSTYDDYDHDDDLPPAPVERGKDREAAALSNSHVQPAELQPRSPHKLPNQQPARPHRTGQPGPHTASSPPENRGGFGAGIF